MFALLVPALFFVSDHETSPELSTADLHTRIAVLASDEFEGREPATPGGRKTVSYLESELKRVGLEPGNGDSYRQDVPLVATTPEGAPELSLTQNGSDVELVFGRDVMLVGTQPDGLNTLDESELVFAGYGIVAPEYGWDDYAGIEAAGKTVVVLVNDPGFATQDLALFRGNAMTYYGRYTYKFEEAARQGAAGVLVVHEEKAAGYPWGVVLRGWGGTQYGLDGASEKRAKFEGWIQASALGRLLQEVGTDLTYSKSQAAAGSFPGLSLGAKLSVKVENSSVRSASHNVLGLVRGSEAPEETILMCAHWDHMGRKPGIGDDEIFNGAFDNASGSSGLMELAEAFAAMDPPPRRSLLFLWVTAEESGLLGSRWYADHPVVPLGKTVAGLNMDGLNIYGPMSDMVVIGYGSSQLEEILGQLAGVQGRTLSPESTPEKGFFYRSDHFSLAKRGVPMLYTKGGTVHRENGAEWLAAQEAEYTAKRYHQTDDEHDPGWNLDGALEDLRLFYALGRRLAQGQEWPNWFEGNEFRAIRDGSR